MTEKNEMLSRWRLILGQFAEESLPLDGKYTSEDDCLAFLYDREYSAERGIRDGGRGNSVLNVPDWLRKIKILFRKENYYELKQNIKVHKRVSWCR